MQPDAANQIERAAERVRDGGERALGGLEPFLSFKLIEISGNVLTIGGVLGALFVLVAVLFASRLAGGAIRRYGARNPKTNPASIYTVSRIVHYVLLALGVMWALDAIGIPMSKFTVFAGALGVGLGFGLQQIFNNFVSGLILLFDRSLKVGDFVQLDANARGVVQAINIRSTRVTTNDNIDILVPNSEFVSGRVTNWTYGTGNRRIRVPFSVAYGVDKELVKKAALEAASKVPFTLSMEGAKAPQVWLINFGQNSVDYILAVWLTEAAARRNVAVKAAYMWELDTALKNYGIEIPFPQRDLRVRSLFGLEGSDALALLHKTGLGPHHDDLPDAEPVLLDDEERARLGRNDARADAEREIAAETDGGIPENEQSPRRDKHGPA
ncbi:MAG: mechanosensitive ion channel [Pseudomonadota bacterium]|nr:mechanosensitive ion channel [Pseudomonadota bacterium]